MSISIPRYTEFGFALIALVAGLAVSVVLAPKDAFFTQNLLFYWVPQLCVLGILLPFKLRAAAFAGVAFGLAIHLALFGYWVFSRTHPGSMAWIVYLFSFPGAITGTVLAAIWLPKRPRFGPFLVGCIAASCVLSGILAMHVFSCSTVFYCRG